MKLLNNFEPGEKVHYDPGYCKPYNGIVKSEDRYDSKYVFVVYHWGNDPDKYYDYTAARTEKLKLKKGWI